MLRIILLILLLFFSNCTTPGTALLGPVITGAKTGSVYQASLSYSSSKIVNQLKTKDFDKVFQLNDIYKKKNPILPDIPYTENNPSILITYKVSDIIISEVNEPEPLP